MDQHKAALQKREDHIAVLAKDLAHLKQENSALLSSISKANSAQGPVKDDGYYVDQFEYLNHLIQSSIAGMFKWKSDADLSNNAVSKVVSLLDSIDPHGKCTLKMLRNYKPGVVTLHKDAVLRMALLRHLIALVLWDKIFRVFAFGLDGNVDQNLRTIERALFSGSSKVNKSDFRNGLWKCFGDPSGVRSSAIAPC